MTKSETAEAVTAHIGLGSNIGDKIANVREAIRRLDADDAVEVIQTSRFYRSAAWGIEDQDWFVNAAVAVRTTLPAEALLRLCQQVENDMGRVRLVKWGPRVIDVDILTYGDARIDRDHLIVPHPFIRARDFVLLPLRDLAPDLKIDGVTLDEALAALETPSQAAVIEDERP